MDLPMRGVVIRTARVACAAAVCFWMAMEFHSVARRRTRAENFPAHHSVRS